jgi:hypothetical protein
LTLVTGCGEVVGSEVLTTILQLALEAGNFFNYGARQVGTMTYAIASYVMGRKRAFMHACRSVHSLVYMRDVNPTHAPTEEFSNCLFVAVWLSPSPQGSAMGFSFEYLPKLKTIKSANNKGVTLVHFLARQVTATCTD